MKKTLLIVFAAIALVVVALVGYLSIESSATRSAMPQLPTRNAPLPTESAPLPTLPPAGSAPLPTPPPAAVSELKLPPGVKGVREVFFVTDRTPVAEASFANEASPDAQVSYGRAVVSIPETHKTGELERPWSVYSFTFPEDARRHVLISSRELLGEDDVQDKIRTAIDSSPEKSAFVFVHGFNVSFDEAVLRTGQLAWDLKFRGPAITYSWPSAGKFARYVSDIDMAEWSAPHLENFLRKLRQRTGARTVHLIAHSMGSRVLTLALAQLSRDAGGLEHAHFQEIVLAAPDINKMIFSQIAAGLQGSAERVTVYSSGRDWALRFSAAIRGGQPRVGGAALAPPLSMGFDIIDATRVKAPLLDLGHSEFAENTLLINDLALLLKERLGPDQRSVLLESSGPIWVFRP